MFKEVYIALGANLPHPEYGAPEQIIDKAVNLLSEVFDIKRRSSLYRTAPIPRSDQPDYANAVIAVETDLNPLALLSVLHKMESAFGRLRVEKNEARVLDLDIIDYDGQVLSQEGIQLPHPRMSERLFVLIPLREIAPDWHHPVTGKSLQEIIAEAPRDTIELWNPLARN
jgi:2-amino-4-hydroxy-6-hydroxymethyldihydropteridine diphosphokinase